MPETIIKNGFNPATLSILFAVVSGIFGGGVAYGLQQSTNQTLATTEANDVKALYARIDRTDADRAQQRANFADRDSQLSRDIAQARQELLSRLENDERDVKVAQAAVAATSSDYSSRMARLEAKMDFLISIIQPPVGVPRK